LVVVVLVVQLHKYQEHKAAIQYFQQSLPLEAVEEVLTLVQELLLLVVELMVDLVVVELLEDVVVV
jgi:hypothetical protein